MDPANRRIQLGAINGVHGIKGWVKVFSHTDPRTGIFNYPIWQLKQRELWSQVEVLQGQPQGKSLVARLQGIDERNAAELLVGAEIYVSRDALPQTDREEYYWFDLIGLEVIDQNGRSLGVIEEMLSNPAHDLLRCKGDDGERLIPWVRERFIIAVDLANKRVDVDWEDLD